MEYTLIKMVRDWLASQSRQADLNDEFRGRLKAAANALTDVMKHL